MERLLKMGNQGMSLVEVIMASGILGFATLTGVFINNSNSGKIMKFQKISELRRQYISNLSFSKSWENTLADSENKFTWCRENFNACKGIKTGYPLSVKNFDNNYFAKVTGNGLAYFDNSLNLCTAQSSACPISVKASWTPVCNRNQSCTQVNLKLEFYYNDNKLPGLDVNSLVNYYLGNGSAKEEVIYVERGNGVKETYKKVKIVFIVDNSSSMANNLDKLEDQLSAYLEQLKDFDFDLYFYTMFSNDFVSIEGSADIYHWSKLIPLYTEPNVLSDLIKNNRGAAKARYQYLDDAKESLQYEIVKDKVQDITPGNAKEGESKRVTTYKYQLREDIARQMQIDFNTKKMSLAEQKNALSHVFTKIKNIKASSSEAGFCSLARILGDNGPNAIIGSEDRAIFIVLSDENDHTFEEVSAWDQYYTNAKPTYDSPCLEQVRLYTQTRNAFEVCTDADSEEDCADYYQMRVTLKFEDVFKHELNVVLNESGELKYKNIGSTESEFNYPFSYYSYRSELKYPENKSSDCDGVLLSKVQAKFPGVAVETCKVRPRVQNSYTNYSSYRGFTEAGWSPQLEPKSVLNIKSCDDVIEGDSESIYKLFGTDKQSSWDSKFRPGVKIKGCNVDFRVTRYKNGSSDSIYNADIKQILNNDWYNDFWKNFSNTGKYQSKRIAYGGKDQLMGNIKRAHEDKLGKDFRYFVSIIHTDPKLCEGDKSGELGVEYLNYTKSTSSPTETHNICNNSFSTAVSNLFSQAILLAKSSYQVELNEGEYISEVKVMRAGNLVTIKKSKYSVFGKMLTFVEGALDDGDELIILIDKV